METRQQDIKRCYRFEGIRLDDQWLSPAYISLDAAGNILAIAKEAPQVIVIDAIDGYALLGMVNAHSHAFQYAMAGLAEIHESGAGKDDFWRWREAMYGLALNLNPQELEAIASMLYAEMLRHGYTHVVEFHYLHHDKDGKPYTQMAEMGERLIAAAATAGIRITLIPILYQKGGFGQAASPRQRRFLSPTIESYHQLLESSKAACQHYAFAEMGHGIHSLRAVEPEIVSRLMAEFPSEIPFHLHISEQQKEIEDALAYLGCRPVEWLLDQADLHHNVHLVHCTHTTEAELRGVAASGAHVVLCPSTEGNLGDGFFGLKTFLSHGGRWSIGTDSHIGLNPFEELRLLDYGQRLRTHQRRSFVSSPQQTDAYQMAWQGGHMAAGSPVQYGFAIGSPFDALVFRADAPLLMTASQDVLLPRMLYASDVSMQLGTIVAGKWLVKEGRHVRGEAIRNAWGGVMQADFRR